MSFCQLPLFLFTNHLTELRSSRIASKRNATKLSLRQGTICYLRNLLLRPLEIIAHLARVFKALRKTRAALGQARLRLCLQLLQLAMLGVQVSRSTSLASASSS